MRTACPGGNFLLAANGLGRSAGVRGGEGCSDSPSLPLDSTLPATGQGLLALDKPKAVGSTGKN